MTKAQPPLQSQHTRNSQSQPRHAHDRPGKLTSGTAAARGGRSARTGSRCGTGRIRGRGRGTAVLSGAAAAAGGAVGEDATKNRLWVLALARLGGGRLVISEGLVAALVDDADHAFLAVVLDAAVEEDGVGVVDGDGEGGLQEARAGQSWRATGHQRDSHSSRWAENPSRNLRWRAACRAS